MHRTRSLSWIPAALALALLATRADAQSDAVYLVLDSESAVYQRDDSGETLYLFPAGARLRLDFGSATRSRIPFTVATDGLDGGALEAVAKRSLRLRLTSPAVGSISYSDGGQLAVELAASVDVIDAATEQSWTHTVRLTTDRPASPIEGEAVLEGRKLDPASGALQLTAAGTVRTTEGRVVGTYHSLVSGRIENLPAAARSLRAP